ncbi:MAG: IS66 family insertion sequence element accessory protein TnpB [Roseateles sp.]
MIAQPKKYPHGDIFVHIHVPSCVQQRCLLHKRCRLQKVKRATAQQRRRLHQGRFVWPRDVTLEHMPLTQPQLQALVLGLPWQRVEDDGTMT